MIRTGHDSRTYLVGGRSERRNIDIARQICGILDELSPRSSGSYAELLTSVTDRPGHDFRYAIDSGTIESELGWRPRESFDTGIRKTVPWYLDNPMHLERPAPGSLRPFLNSFVSSLGALPARTRIASSRVE